MIFWLLLALSISVKIVENRVSEIVYTLMTQIGLVITEQAAPLSAPTVMDSAMLRVGGTAVLPASKVLLQSS